MGVYTYMYIHAYVLHVLAYRHITPMFQHKSSDVVNQPIIPMFQHEHDSSELVNQHFDGA